MESVWIFQGIVGDPGLPGRDGDAGVEVCSVSGAIPVMLLPLLLFLLLC